MSIMIIIIIVRPNSSILFLISKYNKYIMCYDV